MIFKKIIEKYNSIEGYKGTIKFGNETYTILFKKPNKYIAENNSSIIYSNGKTVWIYDKRINSVYKGKDRFNFLDYGKFLHGNVVETEKFYIVGNLTIDKSTLLPISFNGIKFNVTEVKNISDETFELFPSNFNIEKVKKYYENIKEQCEFRIYYPTYTLNLTPLYVLPGGKDAIIIIYESRSLVFINIYEFKFDAKLKDNLEKYNTLNKTKQKKIKINGETIWLAKHKLWREHKFWKLRRHDIYKAWFTKDDTLIVIDTNILDEDEIIKIAQSFKPLE
jgi:outer membrane lipoprotein-sorting protein